MYYINVPDVTYSVLGKTLNLAQSINHVFLRFLLSLGKIRYAYFFTYFYEIVYARVCNSCNKDRAVRRACQLRQSFIAYTSCISTPQHRLIVFIYLSLFTIQYASTSNTETSN